jgi:hypothetical protein
MQKERVFLYLETFLTKKSTNLKRKKTNRIDTEINFYNTRFKMYSFKERKNDIIEQLKYWLF